jgi:uncharacterized protein involved in exopolysaccharide biosynthesis
MELNKHSQTTQRDEIDLFSLVNIVYSQRNRLIKIVILFTFFGLVIAILSPKEFTATSSFVPQISDASRTGGSLGGLASLAGINLGGLGGSSEIPPSLYPKIVSSVVFRKALLESEITVEGIENPISYKYYFTNINTSGALGLVKKYTIGLPGLIIRFIKGESTQDSLENENGFLNISEEDFQLFKKLDQQLSVLPNDKEGFVTISFVMPEPLMAAQMTKIAQELLQKELIAYKIGIAREQLKFTEARFEEKKAEFDQIQKKLGNFRDRNQNIISASAQNELQSLEAEYNFSFNIYTELAKQLEQAKLQVAKDTPIFTIIQPVTVPTEKSAPKRPLIIIIFIILGLIFGLGYIFAAEFVKGVKEELIKM